MLASKMRWEIQRPDQDKVKSLTEQLHITPLVASLLVKRGFDTAESARLFLHTKDADFYDPFEMKGMKEAAERIKQAISQQEKIMIYGDYDADGVTSTSVMLHTLQKLSAQVDFYIPDRFKEGYGPNEQAFRSIKDRGFSLIITVDTGIAAVHEAKVAKELGLDVIITDHHEPGRSFRMSMRSSTRSSLAALTRLRSLPGLESRLSLPTLYWVNFLMNCLTWRLLAPLPI